MEKFSIPEDAKPYVEALHALIFPGLHAAPLENSPLIDLPVVTRRAGETAPPTVRARCFIDVVIDVVDKRLIKNDHKAAEILFALGDWAGTPARERRSAVAKLRDKHWTWDRNYRKEPLERDLFMVFLALYREGDPMGHAQAVSRSQPEQPIKEESRRDGTSNRPLIEGGDYMLEIYESFYNLPREPGDTREFLQTREVIATGDNVEAWRQSSHWWKFNVDDFPRISLFGPGTLSIVQDRLHSRGKYRARSYVTEVKFPRPLDQGDRARFTIHKAHPVEFEEIVKSDYQDYVGLLPAIVQINHAAIGVRFPDNVTPNAVWYFENLPDWLAPGTPAEDNMLEVDESGFVRFEWNNLLIGYSYGVAWRW